MSNRIRFAVVAGALAIFATTASDAFAAGKSTQSNNGLTCHNTWGKTKGSTTCSGNASVRWRLRVRCSFQGDYTGPWNKGEGSDAFECTFKVQSASVQWG